MFQKIISFLINNKKIIIFTIIFILIVFFFFALGYILGATHEKESLIIG